MPPADTLVAEATPPGPTVSSVLPAGPRLPARIVETVVPFADTATMPPLSALVSSATPPETASRPPAETTVAEAMPPTPTFSTPLNPDAVLPASSADTVLPPDDTLTVPALVTSVASARPPNETFRTPPDWTVPLLSSPPLRISVPWSVVLITVPPASTISVVPAPTNRPVEVCPDETVVACWLSVTVTLVPFCPSLATWKPATSPFDTGTMTVRVSVEPPSVTVNVLPL